MKKQLVGPSDPNYRGVTLWRITHEPLKTPWPLKDADNFFGKLTKPYSVRESYERAQREKDPLLAPHGFFRSLVPAKNLHAKEFLAKFGPLKGGSNPELNPSAHDRITVNLEEFWRMHLRFCLIAKLWESRNDKKELPLAWSEIATRAEEASGPEKIPLGKVADRTGQYLFKVFPWEYQRKSFDDWLGSTDFTTLRKEAVCLVNSELNNQVMDKAIYWERGWEVTGEKFRLAIELDSLWSAIWEFFAWDTSGISWRRCPHCQKFFYPKRRDQFYCTPQQQALASKRAYAAWSRAEEQKKKKSRRGLMKRRATKGAIQ